MRIATLLAALAWLTLPSPAPAQSHQPFDLQIGDAARKARQITLVVDQIHDTARGADISSGEVAATLADASIVLVGESHTSYESHRVQALVIQALQRAGRTVILGLEMFPASAPTAPFDRWVRGSLDEAALLRESGWYDYWGYPFGYYREIFEIARRHRLQIRGVNAPRALVSSVGRRGLDGIGAAERAQLPSTIDTTSDEHRQMFAAYVGGTSATHGSGMPPDVLQRMVEAQSTWDAAMAMHAAQLLAEAKDPDAVVVVLVGSGHVAYGLGIARQARAYTDARVATVMPVAAAPGTREQVRASLADLVWGVPKEPYPLYPVLGVSFRSSGEQPNTVLMVASGSPAEAIGIKAGDVLVSLDETPIRKDVDVRAWIDRKVWGDAIRATVKRGSVAITLDGRLRRK